MKPPTEALGGRASSLKRGEPGIPGRLPSFTTDGETEARWGGPGGRAMTWSGLGPRKRPKNYPIGDWGRGLHGREGVCMGSKESVWGMGLHGVGGACMGKGPAWGGGACMGREGVCGRCRLLPTGPPGLCVGWDKGKAAPSVPSPGTFVQGTYWGLPGGSAPRRGPRSLAGQGEGRGDRSEPRAGRGDRSAPHTTAPLLLCVVLICFGGNDD